MSSTLSVTTVPEPVRRFIAPANTFNPWPYGLVAFFAVFIACIITFGIFAARQRQDLVHRDYYEQEVRYQRQLNREERTLSLGERMRVEHLPSQGRVLLRLPLQSDAGVTQGRIHFYRPSDARLDRDMDLAVDTQGRQSLDVTALAEGRWVVRVEWRADGQDYFAEEPVTIRTSL
jgi:hypothetical protein